PGLMIGEKRSAEGLDRMGDAIHLPDTPAIAAIQDGKSVALLNGSVDGLLMIDLDSAGVQKSIDVDSHVWHLTARDGEHGPIIVVASDQAVWLLDGNRWRKIVSLEPSRWHTIALAIAIPLVCGLWVWLRIRRPRSAAML